MDDEPATDVCDRQSPSRCGRFDDVVSEDMAGRSTRGSTEVAARMVRVWWERLLGDS
jgi:hypothetical protein